MTDPTTILIANLSIALQQVNTYLAAGIATAVSAYVIDTGSKRPVTPLPAGFVPMAPATAQLVLLGICFVAGILATNAAEAAVDIVRMLQPKQDLLKAACTYSSVATARIGIRLIAIALPIAFVLPIVWRTWSQLHALSAQAAQGGAGFITLLGFFILPYATLGIVMMRLECR